MSVDYDLVVIGMGAYAHKLVSFAAQRGARVAWIGEENRNLDNLFSNLDDVTSMAQSERALHLFKQLLTNQLLTNQHCADSPIDRFTLFKTQINRQTSSILKDICADESLEILQRLGSDVMFGEVQLCGQSRGMQILTVDEHDADRFRNYTPRRVSTRAIAIATSPRSSTHKIFGLTAQNYLTLNQLFNLDKLPQSVVVLGADALGCVTAQILNWIGVQVKLITDRSHILTDIDVTTARTLQAHLEVAGIEIYTRTQVTAIRGLDHDRVKLWLNRNTIECDRLLIPAASHNFDFDFDFADDRRIYPCTNDRDIAHILAQVLQTNLWELISSPPMVDLYPTFIATLPPLAQIGMTEALARQQCRSRLVVLESYVEQMGLCKFICDQYGQILGASMVGEQAKLVIDAIAIAMQSQIKVQNITVLQELGLSEQWQNLHRHNQQQIKRKNWFTWRRDWRF